MPNLPNGAACMKRQTHFRRWRVVQRKSNRSQRNGRRATASIYSELVCLGCLTRWRAKAGYVDSVPDVNLDELAAAIAAGGFPRENHWLQLGGRERALQVTDGTR